MGPEESTEKVQLYMMADGQPVEIAPKIAEIKLQPEKEPMHQRRAAYILEDLQMYCEEMLAIEAGLADTWAERANALAVAIAALFAPFLGEPDLTMLESGEPLDVPTAWDRKEAREKQRAVERAAASRFRQYKARESAWAARKRTGQRRRERRGPWKES